MGTIRRELSTADSAPAPGAYAAKPWGGWRRALGVLSPAGRRGRLAILIFHRVRERPDDLFPRELDGNAFRERMAWIRSWFNVLPLEDAVAALGRGTLPARALSITFDDGYADNCTMALPILREFDFHATFFVATRYLDGGRMWNDTVIEAVRRATGSELDLTVGGMGKHSIATNPARIAAIDRLLRHLKYLPMPDRQTKVDAIARAAAATLPADLMMTSANLRALASSGMGIGAHTVGHPILARVDDRVARAEIADGRDALENLIGQPVKLFAYPNGKPHDDYAAVHVKMARDLGFTAAVSTARGSAGTGDPVHQLPRFTPWGATQAHWGSRLVQNYFVSIDRVAV